MSYYYDELFAELPREYVSSNIATQAEALDGSRSLVGSHVCKVIEVHSGNRLWLYGTISDCEWDEKDSMATFYFAISEDEPLIAVRCSAGSWLVLDIILRYVCSIKQVGRCIVCRWFLISTDSLQIVLRDLAIRNGMPTII
jgi:hypothetical protein